MDDELKMILMNFYDYMEAQRMVGEGEAALRQHNASLSSSPHKPTKRTRDRDEEDEGMLEHNDRERFEGRTFVPFSDDMEMGEE